MSAVFDYQFCSVELQPSGNDSTAIRIIEKHPYSRVEASQIDVKHLPFHIDCMAFFITTCTPIMESVIAWCLHAARDIYPKFTGHSALLMTPYLSQPHGICLSGSLLLYGGTSIDAIVRVINNVPQVHLSSRLADSLKIDVVTYVDSIREAVHDWAVGFFNAVAAEEQRFAMACAVKQIENMTIH